MSDQIGIDVLADAFNDLLGRVKAANELKDLYPTLTGEFAVRIEGADGQTETIRRACLVQALAACAEHRFLPVVPVKPRLTLWSVAKDGSKWRVYSDARNAGIRTNTKRDALAAMELAQQREAAVIDAWTDQYHELVSNGIEDVDYVIKA